MATRKTPFGVLLRREKPLGRSREVGGLATRTNRTIMRVVTLCDWLWENAIGLIPVIYHRPFPRTFPFLITARAASKFSTTAENLHLPCLYLHSSRRAERALSANYVWQVDVTCSQRRSKAWISRNNSFFLSFFFRKSIKIHQKLTRKIVKTLTVCSFICIERTLCYYEPRIISVICNFGTRINRKEGYWRFLH